MSTDDHAGRINKEAFLASVLTLFIIALIATTFRILIIILYARRRIGLDDIFLLLGVALLTCAVALLHVAIDDIYLVEALLDGVPGGQGDFNLPPDFIERANDTHKWAVIMGILNWFATTAVKLSFLFLFRKLIDRLPAMILFWRLVVAYVVLVWGLGTWALIAACPHFYSFSSLTCVVGSGLQMTVVIGSVAQALDVVGDFLILAIPIRLIWVIRIQWSQKVILSFSLCLTIVVIVLALIRASGLVTRGQASDMSQSGPILDVVWELYWQFLSTDVGLVLTASTAVRTLFVVKSQNNESILPQWAKRVYRGLTSPRYWRSKRSSGGSEGPSNRSNTQHYDLPAIPSATMTGIRTFINGGGKNAWNDSSIMRSQVIEESSGNDDWPLRGEGNKSTQAIVLQQEVIVTSERASIDMGNPRDGSDYV